MITFITILFLHIIGINQNEPNIVQTGNTIYVSVDNVSSDKGNVSFALFKKEGFLKKPLESVYVSITNNVSKVSFDNISPGTYAIVCYHDKNDNKRMDFSESGMPIEDYGTSNNVFNFGPPDFDSSKFELSKEDLELEIRF